MELKGDALGAPTQRQTHETQKRGAAHGGEREPPEDKPMGRGGDAISLVVRGCDGFGGQGVMRASSGLRRKRREVERVMAV